MSDKEGGQCCICHDVMCCNPEDPVVVLPCMHKLHTYCLSEYIAVKKIDQTQLPCPVCKMTPDALKRQAAELLAEPVSSPLPWQDRQPDSLQDIPENADALHIETVVQPDTATPKREVVVDVEALPRSGVVGTLIPRWVEPTVFCSSCGSPAGLTHCRVLSKREGTWRCNKCHVKITTLWRGFGTWPTETFERLSPELKKNFFKDIAEKNASDTIAYAKRSLTKFEQHQKFYEEKGQFLPLSVWATKGFDITHIETKTPEEDKTVHSILGLCYRVALLTTGQSGQKGEGHQDALDSKPCKRKSSQLDEEVESDERPLVKRSEKDRSNGDSDTDETSSTTSTSSSGKKKKKKQKSGKKAKKHNKSDKKKKHRGKDKKKETKKDMKANEKAIKKKERDDARAAATLAKQGERSCKMKETLARQASEKIKAVKDKIEQALVNPIVNSCPSECILTMRMAYEKLKNFLSECNDVLSNPKEHDLSFESMKEVTKVISDAKNAEALVFSVVKRLSKLPRA